MGAQRELFGSSADDARPLPRSRLYRLPLAGDGGASQEGILDYVHRLSAEHCVRVRHLLAEVILPEAGIKGAFYTPGHFSAHSLRGCQGWSGYAESILAALVRLTGSGDLGRGALTGWKSLLDPRGYAAERRRWCPHCLREWRDQGLHHFSLLWAFEPVRVCPIHRCALSSTCRACHSAQPTIGDALAFGRCCSCGSWLHDSIADEGVVVDGAALFKARSLAEMIAARDHDRARPDGFAKCLQDAANRLTNGSLHKLEQRLKLSYGSLRSVGRHRLKFLLEVLYRLGVTPVAFLSEGADKVTAVSEPTAAFRVQLSFRQKELANVRTELLHRLESLRNSPEKVLTRHQLLKDVPINDTMLGSSFISIKEALSAHNKVARVAANDLLWKRRAELIESAMRSLITAGVPLTANRIAEALLTVGLHRRNPRTRRMATDALARLILCRKSPVQNDV